VGPDGLEEGDVAAAAGIASTCGECHRGAARKLHTKEVAVVEVEEVDVLGGVGVGESERNARERRGGALPATPISRRLPRSRSPPAGTWRCRVVGQCHLEDGSCRSSRRFAESLFNLSYALSVESIEMYESALPPQRSALFTLLTARAAELAAEKPDIQDFVFVPGHTHPTWDDGQDRLWRAIEQMMLVSPAGDDELPVVWVGYDVATRFTNRREAQGFLVTDRRLIVKDNVDLVFGKGEARQYPLYVGPNGIAGSAAAIASTAIESYDWDSAESLVDEEDAEWFSQLLVAAITTTLEAVASTGTAIAGAPVTASDIRARVKELGLFAAAKYADDKKHTKHFAKFAKKMPLDPGEQILACFSASTLAGPYGLMLTDRHLRSRGLGEDPVSTPRVQVEVEAVRVNPQNKSQIIAASGEVHEFPSHLGESEASALVMLIQEWAEGRLN